MSESVEQAALRRAGQDTPEPYKSILHLTEAVAEQVAQLHAENAELRDDLLALSNRIEGVSRTLASRTDHLA